MPSSLAEVLFAIGLVIAGGAAAAVVCSSSKAVAVQSTTVQSSKLVRTLDAWSNNE